MLKKLIAMFGVVANKMNKYCIVLPNIIASLVKNKHYHMGMEAREAYARAVIRCTCVLISASIIFFFIVSLAKYYLM